MGLFKNSKDVAEWRAKEEKLQTKLEKLDHAGVDQHDPNSKAAYKDLADHHGNKPLRLFGRS